LRRKTAPAAIVGFSGILVGADTIPASAAPPPVLLVHGDADQVVPPPALFMAANALAAKGVPVQWHMSKGLAHGIDPFGLALAGRFLSDSFSGRTPRTGPVAAPSSQ
jgi:phospholipase/carboxylesterase